MKKEILYKTFEIANEIAKTNSLGTDWGKYINQLVKDPLQKLEIQFRIK